MAERRPVKAKVVGSNPTPGVAKRPILSGLLVPGTAANMASGRSCIATANGLGRLASVAERQMTMRRLLLPILAAALASACGTTEADPGRADSGPHPPKSEDERFLATRYGEFVHALERGDKEGICRHLHARLAKSFRCAGRSRVRLPPALRGIQVPLEEVFAASDPSVPDVIQISARSRRTDGGRLILFFRRTGSEQWRIEETMIGAYG